MIPYEEKALYELEKWKNKMSKRPSIINKASKGIQNKFNNMLPDSYHEIITSSIKNLVKAVLFGSKYITKKPINDMPLIDREKLIQEKTKFYKTVALIEGAATGAGGIILGLADLPLLLSIKIKFLYDVASIYGFDVNDYKERLYILHIFQLAFSSKENVNRVFAKMEKWHQYSNDLSEDINNFDWRSFQQEYRDYIDLEKLLQMLPGIGAVVGSYINPKFIDKLSKTAIQAYRMRIFDGNYLQRQ